MPRRDIRSVSLELPRHLDRYRWDGRLGGSRGVRRAISSIQQSLNQLNIEMGMNPRWSLADRLILILRLRMSKAKPDTGCGGRVVDYNFIS
jgi:hypothetical protein